MSLINEDPLDKIPEENAPDKEWINWRFLEEIVRFQQITGTDMKDLAKMLDQKFWRFKNYVYSTTHNYYVPADILAKCSQVDWDEITKRKFNNLRPIDWAYVLTGEKRTELEKVLQEQIEELQAEILLLRRGRL